MKRGIVGYTGFVGSNLLQFYKFDSFYNSKNFHEAKNMIFDELFFAGIPAVKWLANKNPEEDSLIINKIKAILKTIKVKKIILISTIDVYEYVNSELDEDYNCDSFNNHPYGANRYLFEDFIKNQFENYHIIRLPALFGKGIKKNIIFDLIYKNQIENISKDCFFQWYDLNWLKKDIDLVIKNNIKICNFFTEPLSSLEIIKLFEYPIEEFKNKSKIIYNTKTKFSELFDSSAVGYIRDKTSVLHNLRIFINFQKMDKSSLVVSNICVKNIFQLQFACLLKLFGIKNVQIAPTTLVNSWENLQEINLDIYEKNDLNVYSFQSITFGLNNLNIFDISTNENLFNHLKKIIDFAIIKGISILVFGCPKNRKINQINEENDEIFCSFFQKLGDYIGNNKLKICIEPNSKLYGCNYINTIKEAGELVKKINNKNIKMMVDNGNIMMEKDNLSHIYDFQEYIFNIDISNENMKPFIKVYPQHKEFISILNKINYKNKINLEMLLKDEEDDKELEILCESLNNFINIQNFK